MGTVGDKVRRIRKIADALAVKLDIPADQVESVSRAADICKFDLVTQMVYEFPELQGVMGEDYALKAGERAEVARAIFEHYQPRSASDNVPASMIGSIVSIADKIDTIVGCFSIGIIPTGSQDPYALRRQAAGIVQIAYEHELPITLDAIFEIGLGVHESMRVMKRPADEIRKDLQEFFGLRVKKLLSETMRYDVVDAVISAQYNDIVSVTRRGAALMNAVVSEEDFKTTVDSFNRVGNLAAKASNASVSEEVFVEDGERKLYDAWKATSLAYQEAIARHDAEKAAS